MYRLQNFEIYDSKFNSVSELVLIKEIQLLGKIIFKEILTILLTEQSVPFIGVVEVIKNSCLTQWVRKTSIKMFYK